MQHKMYVLTNCRWKVSFLEGTEVLLNIEMMVTWRDVDTCFVLLTLTPILTSQSDIPEPYSLHKTRHC